MRQHNGVTTQLNRSEGTNKAGRELICTLEERIWKENETTNAGQSPSVDSPKSTKTRHFCQQRPRLAAVDQPICYTLNEAIAKIPSEKFSTKISKLKQRITAPKQMVGQKKEADNQANSGRVISTFSGAEHGRHNNECGEAICYSDQTTTKQKSSSLMQQHSFETDGSNEITKQRLQRLRRKSTSSRKNMSLSHRYTAPFSSSKGCAGFIVPPVFPKTCSLYDESFSGGVFVDHQEDRLLVEAVDRIRKRNFSCKEKEHDGCLQKQQTSADASQINSDFINENSDIDSGNSSITEGRQSPICLPEFTRNFGRTEATQLKKAAENSDVASDANWKDNNQREGFLRKNCRLLHFVKKKGSESLDNEHMQNDDRENDKLPAERQWETDTTKRKSWRARLLRTLSVGSPSVGRVIKDKEKQRELSKTPTMLNLIDNEQKLWFKSLPTTFRPTTFWGAPPPNKERYSFMDKRDLDNSGALFTYYSHWHRLANEYVATPAYNRWGRRLVGKMARELLRVLDPSWQTSSEREAERTTAQNQQGISSCSNERGNGIRIDEQRQIQKLRERQKQRNEKTAAEGKLKMKMVMEEEESDDEDEDDD